MAFRKAARIAEMATASIIATSAITSEPRKTTAHDLVTRNFTSVTSAKDLLTVTRTATAATKLAASEETKAGVETAAFAPAFCSAALCAFFAFFAVNRQRKTAKFAM